MWREANPIIGIKDLFVKTFCRIPPNKSEKRNLQYAVMIACICACMCVCDGWLTLASTIPNWLVTTG